MMDRGMIDIVSGIGGLGGIGMSAGGMMETGAGDGIDGG